MIIGSLPNADRNNLIPEAEDAFGVTTEALLHTDTQFSFNIHFGTGLVEGTDPLPATLAATVGLMERPGTDGPWVFVAADCPLAVNWEYSFATNTVTEIWTTFGVEIVSARRLNIDVGWARPGPRYTLRLNDANYEGHIDIKKGDPLRCVVPAPAGGFPFPLRLVMSLSAVGAIDFPSVRDIILEGQIGHKALLSAEIKDEWRVLTSDLHLRIYKVGEVPGAPVDIDFETPAILTNLVSYWKMDETSGTRSDSRGTNDLTDNNTVTSAAGIVNTAAQLTAANSESLSIADNVSLSVSDIDWAFGVWVYLDSKATSMDIISKFGASGQFEYIVLYSVISDRFSFGVSSNGTAFAAVAANNFGIPPLATWTHLYVYHDSVTNVIGISVNNGTANTAAHTTGVFDGTSVFHIGHRAAGGATHFNGRIDEPAFWKGRVLTAGERAEIFTNPNWFHEL